MVVAVVEGERVLGRGADVVPARAELRSAGKIGFKFVHRNPRRQDSPALVQQRHAAGREPRGEDQVHGVRLRAVGDARGGDGQKVAVHHVEKIARRKAVGGREDVGLAPADELLSRLHGEAAAGVGGAEAADGEQRTASSAIPPDAAPVARGLLVGVGARVDGAGEAQVGEFVEGLVAEERLADEVGAVVGRRLWIDKRGGLQEAALREVLCVCGGERARRSRSFIARGAAPGW